MDKIKSYILPVILGAVCGFVGCLFFFHNPDMVSYKSWTNFKSHDTGTTTITVIAHASVTGGTSATIKPDGSVVVSGSNLSIGTSSQTSTTITTVHDVEYKEKIIDKTIYYNGLVRVLWSELKPAPALISADYTVSNPFILSGEYNAEIKHYYFGIGMKF